GTALDRAAGEEARDVVRGGLAFHGGEGLEIGIVDLRLAARRLGRAGSEKQGKKEQAVHRRRRFSGNQIRAKNTATPAPFRVVTGWTMAEWTMTNPAIARKIKGGSG